MKLSIIIPTFNEKTTIEEILKRVIRAPVLDYQKEIIIVDDGSTDGTTDILKNLREELDFIYIKHPKNSGKGAAIKTALKEVTGDLALIQDADLEYNPDDYQNLLEAFNQSGSVVYGSRNINPQKKSYFHYFLGVKFLTFLTNLLFKAKLTDVYTCYKLFPASLIKSIPLNSQGFEFEAEITTKILKRGVKIKEIPIDYQPRKFSQGKKIHFQDGLFGLGTIIKYWIKENNI